MRTCGCGKEWRLPEQSRAEASPPRMPWRQGSRSVNRFSSVRSDSYAQNWLSLYKGLNLWTISLDYSAHLEIASAMVVSAGLASVASRTTRDLEPGLEPGFQVAAHVVAFCGRTHSHAHRSWRLPFPDKAGCVPR